MDKSALPPPFPKRLFGSILSETKPFDFGERVRRCNGDIRQRGNVSESNERALARHMVAVDRVCRNRSLVGRIRHILLSSVPSCAANDVDVLRDDSL